MKKRLLVALLIGAATVAVAHDGVKNAAVLARMDAMQDVGAQMKTIGRMAKGEVPFDATAARVAAERLAGLASDTPRLFEPRETDPKSEARPAIWDEFDRFEAHAAEMERAALDAQQIEDMDDLRSSMAALGATCRDCHQRYRD